MNFFSIISESSQKLINKLSSVFNNYLNHLQQTKKSIFLSLNQISIFYKLNQKEFCLQQFTKNQIGPLTMNKSKQLKINIVLLKQGQMWPMSIQQTVSLTQNNQIRLTQIILKLKRKNFNDIYDSSVSYYHFARQLFIFGFFIARDIHQTDLEQSSSKFTKLIPFDALQNVGGQLNCKLRLRKRIKTKVQRLIQEQQQKFGQSNADNQQNKRVSKQKQKTIAQVIQKVALWRKLYTGFPSQTGKLVHYQLESAATQIHVIKKTLDDYLLQIRNGKRHGYNFHKNKDAKIGDLRSFVRERKQKQPKK